MRRVGLAVTLGALLVATAGQAATITNLSFDAGTIVTYPFTVETYGQTGPVPPGTSTSAGGYGGTDFSSFIQNVGGTVSFESSDVASGLNVLSVSHTSLGFTFTNDATDAVEFQSLITAAGMGFYLADVEAGCQYSSCAGVTGVNLQDVLRANPFAAVASVGFEFTIQDNGTSLFYVKGTSVLDRGVPYSDTFVFGNATGAIGFLNNLRSSDLLGDNASHGFLWDATPVSFFLAPGVHNLTYKTSVFSGTNAQQLSCGASVVAYAGFGDPIGRGGGVDEILESLSASDFAPSAVTDACPANGDITGLNFTPATFNEPRIRDGNLVYETAEVPEPATWAMMILGFGGIGAALRRRRHAGAIA